jgi:MYXO-CTERM domain-containing protein
MKTTFLQIAILTIALCTLSKNAAADVPPPGTEACRQKAAGDSCIPESGGTGTCVKRTCTSIYPLPMDGSPGGSTYDCLKCEPGASPTGTGGASGGTSGNASDAGAGDGSAGDGSAGDGSAASKAAEGGGCNASASASEQNLYAPSAIGLGIVALAWALGKRRAKKGTTMKSASFKHLLAAFALLASSSSTQPALADVLPEPADDCIGKKEGATCTFEKNTGTCELVANGSSKSLECVTKGSGCNVVDERKGSAGGLAVVMVAIGLALAVRRRR